MLFYSLKSSAVQYNIRNSSVHILYPFYEPYPLFFHFTGKKNGNLSESEGFISIAPFVQRENVARWGIGFVVIFPVDNHKENLFILSHLRQRI